VLGFSALTRQQYAQLMQQTTLIYGFSEHLLPKPKDWPQSAHVVGPIFLETDSSDWRPPAGLLEFLDQGPKPVCIGFSSMNPKEDGSKDIDLLAKAARRSGQRAVILTGWTAGVELGNRGDLFLVDALPHDWIFQRVSAAVHHGGAGSTSSALRAGLPSVIVPFAFDQLFWGRLVQARNAGLVLPRRHLTVERLAADIDRVVNDKSIRENAQSLGVKIAAEDGTGRAVELIEQAVKDAGKAATMAV
jgi:sterol 3beta-glucosyltransferase